MLICPNCTSGKIVKNGRTYCGKQNHKCIDCNRQFVANNQLIPPEQHKPGKAFTYYIEGYFTGVRARVSRLVRKTLSFSKDLSNHVAAIRYFLWQRNLDSYPYI
ncbi:hypothetical protein FUA23_08190 [Neolewinella aurantiaca]|uniref:Transposase n=1 Tax=Neolewinella aurantiaca TaxID=2602767 RepID=A0A5C7FHH7_9BACT|nr:hypothetical protein FUA23_08190 [Neolewinella aurantiaca]